MHPALRIVALILLAIGVQLLPPSAMLLAGALLVVTAAVVDMAPFLRMLRRSRWLMVTILLVFAFSTPGEYLTAWPYDWGGPTHEGIFQGMLQAGRLAMMLAGLAVLMGTTSREQLIAGIFVLMQPFRRVGVVPERFASRLWLTLHYVESAPVSHYSAIWAGLDSHDLPLDWESIETIPLEVPVWTKLDWVWAGGLALAAIWGGL